MNNKAFINPPHLSNEKSLKTSRGEQNRLQFKSLRIKSFETYKSSILVPLKFNDLVVTSMLREKSNASLMIPV
jgi:hypothetical protein